MYIVCHQSLIRVSNFVLVKSFGITYQHQLKGSRCDEFLTSPLLPTLSLLLSSLASCQCLEGWYMDLSWCSAEKIGKCSW